MDTKKEDTDLKTAREAPAMPEPGEPGPGPSAVPSKPLHGPVDVAEDSMEGLRSAFRALSVEEVDTQPVKRKREREKDAGESITDEGADQGHDPTNDPTFEGGPSAFGLHASPSPITTTLPTPDPAAATSTPITNPPMAEGTGFTGMPTYPAYGVNPPTTAFPEATTTSEPVTSSSAPRWYAADYHHPLVISQGIGASQKLSGGSILDLSKLQDPRTLGYLLYPLREPMWMFLGMQP